MNYSELFLGHSLNDLTYEIIEHYFSEPKEETDTIEFKSFTSTGGSFEEKLKDIYKAVCAMLNSDGGIIIWGSPSGVRPAGRTEKLFQGALTHITPVQEKDRLINKISSNLIPIPSGVNVKIIEIVGGTGCICVFEIQKSVYSPHQFQDRYYMRLDGQSRPAPHHYVEALFRKIKYPNLEGYLKFNELAIVDRGLRLDLEIVIWNFSPLQNETFPFFMLTTLPGIFAGHSNVSIDPSYRMKGTQFVQTNIVDVLHFGLPSRTNCSIHLPTASLSHHSGIISLILNFGGKLSPAKTSKYTLSLTNPISTRNVNQFIEEEVVNKLMIDVQGESQVTRQQQLREYFGREIE